MSGNGNKRKFFKVLRLKGRRGAGISPRNSTLDVVEGEEDRGETSASMGGGCRER